MWQALIDISVCTDRVIKYKYIVMAIIIIR